MDPQPNQIPTFQYTAGTMDLGKDFAGGLTAGTTLGKEVGEGVTSALNVATRSQAAHDTLDVMAQQKILSPEAYAAIKGKSLTAQEGLIGMYANQWIAQQAQQRALQTVGYTGAVDVQKQKEIMEYYQSKGFMPPGIDARKLPASSLGTTGGTGSTGSTGGGGGTGAPVAGAPPPAAVALAGLTQNPSPLGSGNIYSPLSLLPTTSSPGQSVPTASTPVQSQGISVGGRVPGAPQPVAQPQITKTGAPMGAKEAPPPNATIGHMIGPKGDLKTGFILPDGTFRERPT